MFLLTFGIANGVVAGDEYFATMKETIEELKDATLI